MSQLKCALIGAGRIANDYAVAIAQSDEIQLAAVVDSQLELANAVAEKYDCKGFRSVQSLLNSSLNLDFALICTPPVTHHSLTIQCLNAGLHVLCEKPFAIHSDDAREMIEVASKNDLLLSMGSKFRYVPEISQARQIVQEGVLGDVIFFENVFASRVDMSQRWNSDPRISGGGVLMDNGTHSLDITRYVFGPLTEVQVLEGVRAQNLAVEDTVQINVRSSNRALGRIDLSWSLNKGQDSYLSVYGSEGTLIVGWKGSRFQLHGQTEWKTFGEGYSKIAAFSAQLRNFVRAIQGEEPLLIDAHDGLASVLAVESAYESLRQFHWTTIPALTVDTTRVRVTVGDS